MKKITFFSILAVLFFSACSQLEEAPLCLVDGEAWHGIQQSGSVITDPKTGVKLYAVAFTSRMSSSEAIRLRYDYETGKLVGLLYETKRPGKNDQPTQMTLRYDERNKALQPNSAVRGKITSTEGSDLFRATFDATLAIDAAYTLLLKDQESDEVKITNGQFDEVMISQ